jgi:hypothetical protein
MTDADVKALGNQIVRGLSGSLTSLIEAHRADILLSQIRPKQTGSDRILTKRDFENFMRRGLPSSQNGGDDDRFS